MAASIAAHGLLLASLQAPHPATAVSREGNVLQAQLLKPAEVSPKPVPVHAPAPQPKPKRTSHPVSHQPSIRHRLIVLRKSASMPSAKPSSEPLRKAVHKSQDAAPVARTAAAVKRTAPAQLSASAVKARESRVRNHLEQYIYYPASARLRGIEGVVELSFRLAPGGRAEKVRVLASSGYRILDQAALETVSRAQPFPATGGRYQFRLRFRSL